MSLWLLKPRDEELRDGLWSPWYDKAFGFVVKADTEKEARALAQDDSGDETGYNSDQPAWTDSRYSTCDELTDDGESRVILQDFKSA